MMTIDSFYSVADKSNYYLGMISQVNRSYSTIQIENLSLFSYRKRKIYFHLIRLITMF